LARDQEDILPVGLEIYQEIIATIGGEGMIICDTGLLEGILLSLLETAQAGLPDHKSFCW